METHFHSSKIKQLEHKELLSQTKKLQNKELLSRTKQLVQKERNRHIQILYHLGEIESRKLYLGLGFSSLFDYVVKELGYSEGAAYRRIKAMKLCRDLPGTRNRLQSGRLSLSAACQLQVFFEKRAKKAREKEKKSSPLKFLKQPILEGEHQKQEEESASNIDEKLATNTSDLFLSQKEKEGLVEKAEGRSTRATAKLLSDTDPLLFLIKERTRFLGKGRVEIKAVIDEECHKNLQELKSLLSHKNPSLSYGELLSILSKEALKKHDPRRRNIREKKTSSEKTITSAPKSRKISRTIPSRLRKYIWERDEGQCTYVHRETEHRCSARHLLQIDHIQPFALGGKTEKENLRLLCAGHNRYRR